MSMRGPNFPPRGGPRFNNFSGPGPGGFMPMGPNHSGMRGPPPFQGPGQQFEPPFGPPNQGPPQPLLGPSPLMTPPREMSPMQRMSGPGYMGGPSGMPPGLPPGLPKIDPTKEVWVETLSDQGKVYYYHAKTRQSVWKKPMGDNIQIITQNEAQALAAAIAAGIIPPFGMGGQSTGGEDQSGGQMNNQAGMGNDENMESAMNDQSNQSREHSERTSNEHGADIQQSDSNQNKDDTNENVDGQEMDSSQGGQQQNGPMMGQPPMGSMMGQRPLMMGPPNQMMHMQGMPGGFPRMQFPGQMPHPMMGGPMMPPGGTVWRAHNAPDGRTYYYNITTMETQWNKPKELEEMEEAAKKAAEMEANKMQEVGMNTGPIATEIPKESVKHIRMEYSEQSRSQPAQSPAVITEEDKAKQKQRPVATNPVPGTPWCVVWTGDEKVFFYNPTTKLSMWVRPEELRGRTDIDKILADPPHKRKRPIDIINVIKSVESETSDTAAQAPAKKKKKQQKVSGDALTAAEKSGVSNPSAIPLETRMKQFKEMLHERQVSAFSTWDKELHKIVFDPRYTLLNIKERRQVFDDYVKARAEEERKEKKAHLLKTREEFKKLLEEAKISNRTSFSEFAGRNAKDPRFKAIDRMKERESLFNEFMQESKKKKNSEAKNKLAKIKTDYMELLEEKHAEKYSRWSRAKEKISSDPRYSAVEQSTEREETWNEYCEQKKKSKSDDDEETVKKRRTEESMKARLEQVEKEKAERSREIDTERQKHRLEEAIQHFKALLADMVRNTDQSWSDTRRQLRKEARWEMASLLSKDEKEKYFDEHIEALNKRKRSSFKQLLEENAQIELSSTWKEVRKLIKEDPRYTKFSSSDRKREREFDEFIKDKKMNVKAEFRNFLRETKIITHKSKELIKNNPQHMKEILAVLENDKRYLILDCLTGDRDDMIYYYMDDLHRKGPPPPPTASEPSRRGLKN